MVVFLCGGCVSVLMYIGYTSGLVHVVCVSVGGC